MSSPFISVLDVWKEYRGNFADNMLCAAYVHRAIRNNLRDHNNFRRENWSPARRANMAQPGKDFRAGLKLEHPDFALDALAGILVVASFSVNEHLRQIIERVFGDRACICDVCHHLRNSESMHEPVNDASAQVCGDCIDRGIIQHSAVMGGYLINRGDNSHYYADAASYEDSEADWVTRAYARDHGFVSRNGIYYADTDLVEELFNDTFILRNYHSGWNMGHIPSAYDERKPRVLLGLELEVEVPGDDDDEDDSPILTTIAKGIMKGLWKEQKGYCKVEQDGSLNHGFEIITGYTGLDVHARVLKTFSGLKGFSRLRSHDTSTCGLHVHVDRKEMTSLHAAKLQQFIHAEENAALIRTVARRYGEGSYARFHSNVEWLKRVARNTKARSNWNDTKEVITDDITGERYEALNWRNSNTVEFRFFRGSTRFETIMACLEFAFCAWHFTRQTSIAHLSADDFLKWITKSENRRDSKHLRAYLRTKKFKQFFVAEAIARPADKKIKEEAPLVDLRRHEQESDVAVDMARYILSPAELAAIRESQRVARGHLPNPIFIQTQG